MPGTDIEAYLEELEDLINNGKSPISGGGSKKIIDADTAYAILDDIKRSLPEEFSKARRVLRNEKEILDSAEDQAAHMVRDAEAQAALLASDQEVVRLANNMAEDIRRHAEEDARDIRNWAEDAAENMFAQLEEELRSALDKTSKLLEQAAYCRNIVSGHFDNPEDAPEQDPRYALQ